MASDTAPGLAKSGEMLLNYWLGHNELLWQNLVDEAEQREQAGLRHLPNIYGSDISHKSLDVARNSIQAAGYDDVIEISVQDTGIGIKEDEIPRVFDKFYRSDDEQIRAQTGHGLGLSLVQQIVYIHHGKIKVDSEFGKGTTFSIQLDKDVAMQQLGVA